MLPSVTNILRRAFPVLWALVWGGTFELAAALPEEDPSSTVANVVALLEADRFDAAVEAAQDGFVRWTEHGGILAALGSAAFRAGQVTRATEVLVHARRVAPTARGLAALSRCWVAQGDTAAAGEAAREAVVRAPGLATGWLALASVHARERRYSEATRALERALLVRDHDALSTPEERRAQWVWTIVRTLGTEGGGVAAESRKGRVPMRFVAGRPVVDVEFVGHDGAPVTLPLLLDTGGSFALGLDVSLRDAVAFQETGRRHIATVRGTYSDAPTGWLPELSFGAWQYSQVPAAFFPLHPEGADEPPYLGNLGPFLADGRVWILNFRKGYVSVLRALPRGRVFPAETSEDELQVPFLMVGDGKVLLALECAGQEVLALLDTGAEVSQCSRRFAQQKPWPAVRLHGKEFLLGNYAVREALDDVLSPLLGIEISLMLGMDVWRSYGVMTLDYATQTLTLTPRGEERR